MGSTLTYIVVRFGGLLQETCQSSLIHWPLRWWWSNMLSGPIEQPIFTATVTAYSHGLWTEDLVLAMNIVRNLRELLPPWSTVPWSTSMLTMSRGNCPEGKCVIFHPDEKWGHEAMPRKLQKERGEENEGYRMFSALWYGDHNNKHQIRFSTRRHNLLLLSEHVKYAWFNPPLFAPSHKEPICVPIILAHYSAPSFADVPSASCVLSSKWPKIPSLGWSINKIY